MDSYDAFRDYEHRVGRWWMLTGFALLLAVPTAICVRYNAWPPITWVLKPARRRAHLLDRRHH